MESIINIIITTSVTALVILVVRSVLKDKTSPKLRFVLWAVLTARLLVPIFPQSGISVFNFLPNAPWQSTALQGSASEGMASGEILPQGSTWEGISPQGSPSGEVSDMVTQGSPKAAISAWEDSIWKIWFSGFLVMLFYMLGVYCVYHLKTRKYRKIQDTALQSLLDGCKRQVGVNADVIVRIGGDRPLLKGIIKPEIILPKGYTQEELKGVFIHELMHLKHRDTLWNMLSTLLICIHWFNPVIWYCYFAFRRDIEILCDYRVLKVYDNRKGYAALLLKTALNKNSFPLATTAMHNGRRAIINRIKAIACFKRTGIIWTIVAVAAVVTIAALCLTNPIDRYNNPSEVNDAADELDYDRIYQYKNPYVGNGSNVSNLTGSLYYAEYKNGISLQTSAQSYGITVNYLVEPGVIAQDGVVTATDEMFKNAAVIFCLIDNVDTVTFSFDDGSGIYSLPFERSFFNQICKGDIREYSVSIDTFKDQFIPMIESMDWRPLTDLM
ncbi:MAG: M56 family metallopeptidase [Mahellales bacterium]|jgi:beta-lactamase regulating signal transducer with metallopeptidase domain